MAKDRAHLRPKKSVFNRIIGDNSFELEFARSLEEWKDVASYAKNYFAVRFKLDYVNADGDISNYYPDFIVKRSDGGVFIIETKGLEGLDVPLKMARLKAWCRDVNQLQSGTHYDFVYVDQPGLSGTGPNRSGTWSEVLRPTRTAVQKRSDLTTQGSMTCPNCTASQGGVVVCFEPVE